MLAINNENHYHSRSKINSKPSVAICHAQPAFFYLRLENFLSHIRNRKHARAGQPLLTQSLIALAALGAPLAAHAQSATAPKDVAMPELSVTATADVPYKADKVQSPKLTQPLVDTTQTISVIRKEVLQEQGASSIVEALRNTPGITLQLGENGNTSAGDTFQMRGFATQSSIFVDGVRDLGPVSRDVFNIEQVEVSKGPAGADIGRGAASGYINLVTKTAQADDFTTGSASINSAANKRVTADLNRSLSPTSAFRINVMGQDGGVLNRDRVDQSVLGIAPSVAFGLGTATRFSLQSQHMRQDNVPDGGIPSIGLPGFYSATSPEQIGAPRVNVNNFYGLASDFEKVDADMITAKVEHDLEGGIKLTNTTRYGKSKMDRVVTGINAITSSTGAGAARVVLPQSQWSITRSRQSVLQDNEILANLTSLVSEFKTGGLSHTLSTGLEFMNEKQTSFGRDLVAGPNANLYAPNLNDAISSTAARRNGAYTRGATTTAAVYAFDTVKLSEQFHLNGGLRYEHYKTDTNGATVAAGVITNAPMLQKSDTLVSWKAGALYKPAPNGSIYAAFATSKTPPGSANFTLNATASNIAWPNMDPQETRNVEFGTKWDVLAKQLAVTAALYRTENKNEFTLLDSATNTYSQLGKRRVQGIELGMVGQFTRNWQVIAGVATMKATVLEGTTGNNRAGAQTRWSPDLTATLWSAYKVNDKFTVGGGLRYTSEQKRLVDPTVSASVTSLPEIPGYTVADAMLGYKVTDKVSVQLNVYNVFDKFFINTLNNGGSRYSLGQERSAQLSANIAF